MFMFFMDVSLELFSMRLIHSFKFSIELYRFPKAHRNTELYSICQLFFGRGGTVILFNKDSGSHSAHRDKWGRRVGRGGVGCERQEGERSADRAPWGVLC